jgi:hypothetical protein
MPSEVIPQPKRIQAFVLSVVLLSLILLKQRAELSDSSQFWPKSDIEASTAKKREKEMETTLATIRKEPPHIQFLYC